ncbi:MAG TPA: phytanoyl-CoA dioxygenase family protein, partial [Niastella sp.]
NPVMLQKEIGGRWLTTAYSAGDIVIFSTNTIHGSLDNMSANIRLSVDCRYQLAVDPMDERWLSNVPLARNVAFKKGKIC